MRARLRNLGLGTRVLIAFAALIVLLAIYSFWSYRLSRDERLSASLEETEQSAHTVAALMHGLLRDLDGTTLAIAYALGAQQRPLNQETVGGYLSAVQARYPFTRAMFLTDPRGIVLASSLQRGMGQDIGDRSYVRAIRDGQDFFISELFSGAETSVPTIAMSRAVRSPNGDLRGILIVAFYTDNLTSVLPGALPEDSTITVFDRRGNLIYTSTGPVQLNQPRDRNLVERVQRALEGQVTRFVAPVDDTDRVSALAPVPEYGWAVGSSRTLKAVEAPLQSFYRRQLVALALMIGLAFLLALVLSRALARPLVRLAEQARSFGKGERGVRAVASGPAEVHTLAAAFNQMAAEVEARFAEREAAEEALREESEITETLYRVGAVVAEELDTAQVVQSVTDAATRITGAQFGAFFYNLVDERGESYTLYAISGVPREQFEQFPMPRNTAIFDPTFRGQGIVRSDDITRDPRYGKNTPYQGIPPGHLPVRSYLAAPVVSRSGEVLGGLFFGHPNPGVFTERAERIVGGMATQAAIALDKARLYENERAAREAAESANRAKDEFLSVLSHELRTPLTPIIGFTEMLRRRKQVSPETLQRALETIDRSAKAQARLVSDLLDVSRIISGKLELEVQPVDLNLLVEAAVEAARPSARAASVTLTADLDPRGAPVSGDPDRLQQVMGNLISNAIKFTPENGSVHVQLTHEEGEARITVSDTGRGISAEFLPHVFDRFRQADASSTRVFGGLGLGLAIVRHLVEMHGGRVSAESEGQDKGATFTVWLPLARIPTGTGDDNGAAPVESDGVPKLSGVRVLLVEDDPDTRGLLRLILETEGALVTTAETAPQAFDLLKKAVPDVLLADIGLPDEDGYSLIRKVRALPPEQGGGVCALALTAYAGTEDRRRALAAGFQSHVAKPVEPDALITAVAGMVQP